MATPTPLRYQHGVAIDFGTSHTGFAFSTGSQNQDNIYMTEVWPDAQSVGENQYCKTRTVLVYNKKNPSEDPRWGHTAVKDYYQQFEVEGAEESTDLDLCLFQYFKMGLFDAKNPFREDISNQMKKPTTELITDYLRLLWKFIQQTISKIVKYEVKPENISWCLSMPAIWEDKHKDQMKKAAYAAGMLHEKNPSDQHFQCVLEPEAAAAECISHMKMQDSTLVQPGQTILICDAGGGTVDITCYKIDQTKQLVEYKKGGGNAFGSAKLQEYFEEFLQSKFGNENIVAIKKHSPLGWSQLIQGWEKTKCSIKNFRTAAKVQVPPCLHVFFTDLSTKEENSCFSEDFGTITIKPFELSKIFKVHFEEICKLLLTFCPDGEKPYDYLFMVGGFSQSEVLQKAIKENLKEKVNKFIIPDKPGECIIRGCIRLGRDPTIIKSRKVRRSYGIRALIPFDSKVHPQSKLIVVNGEQKAKDGFAVFVKTDDEVSADSVVTREFKVMEADQNLMVLGLYATPRRIDDNTTLTTDPGIGFISLMEIDISKTKGIDRKVQVNMYFGKSQLQMEAIDKSTGKKYQMAVDFNENKASEEDKYMKKYEQSMQQKSIGGPFHFIFANDGSGSMSGTPYQELLNALRQFYQSRYQKSTQDIVSVITFSSGASIDFQQKPLTANLGLNQSPPYGGTNYRAAVDLINQILSSPNSSHTPIVFFMSDGQCSDDGSSQIIQQMCQRIPNLVFNSVGFGNCDFSVIQNFAQIGRGKFLKAITVEELKQAYQSFLPMLDK